MLSPAYCRDSVYIAIHAPINSGYEKCFKEPGDFANENEGRFQLGKLILLIEYLLNRFPLSHRFCELRNAEDPQRIF